LAQGGGEWAEGEGRGSPGYQNKCTSPLSGGPIRVVRHAILVFFCQELLIDRGCFLDGCHKKQNLENLWAPLVLLLVLVEPYTGCL